MPYLFIVFFSACFGLSIGILVLESAHLPWMAPLSARLGLWRAQQAQRLRRLGVRADGRSPWQQPALGLLLGTVAAWTLDLGLLSLVGLGLGLAWPRLQEAQLRAERARRLSEQMPGLFEALAASLRAGQSLNQAFASAAEDLPQPAAALLQDASLRIGLGAEPENALHEAGRDIEAALQADWRMLCTSVAVVRSSGGKLPELLDQLASTVRERQRLQALIQAQTAQAKLSAWVVGCLPPALLVAMQALDPDLVAPLFHTTTGWAILALAVLLEAAGLFLLRKMTEVRA